MTNHEGKQALARVLEQLARGAELVHNGTEAKEAADVLWNDFRTAVAHAVAETRESEQAGVVRWRDVRHPL